MQQALTGLTGDDPRRIGAYRLLYRLGEGGMGRVYLARSPGGRTVALKVVHGAIAGDRGFRTRFAREVRAARSLRGAGTVPVLDADPEADMPWLATAYVPGPALSDAVLTHGPLPEPARWRLLSGLARALEGVHAAGLVHRDVKPSNVLLAQAGPLLIDFGIARSADETALTGTGLVVGSPGYMAPEQAEGRTVGSAADVFSLGAVLAFAASGRGPFRGGSVAELLYRVVHHEPDLADLDGSYGETVRACLAKRPDDRPDAAALRALAEGHGQDAGPWLPAPVVAAIAQKAEELLNAEAEVEESEPASARASGLAEPDTATRSPAADPPAADPRAADPPAGADAVTSPAYLPPPTAVLPGAPPSPSRDEAVGALRSGMGQPLQGLWFLLPMLAYLLGGVQLMDWAERWPDPADQQGGLYRWALGDSWRLPGTLLLVGAMAGLHWYRGRLSTAPVVRIRLWSAAVGVYWIGLCAALVLHVLWFWAVYQGIDHDRTAGEPLLTWLTVPVLLLALGVVPVVATASAVRIVKA
ncbi:serine/threonine-protein kinase [Streptomyces sp. NPDC048604]|uniref:serine/threonine-protein kinase n=1 Tax=Streptomyces sp. NPDC048604 TaxID=3365578 RepID=UPI00371F5A96